MSSQLKICDVSLRDGSHVVRHQFTVEQVVSIASALDAAGVAMVEVSHGDGLGGSSLQYGLSRTNELELIRAARAVLSRAKLTVLLLPGIGTREDLKAAHDLGAEVVRVATHCTEADIAQQHIAYARELGMEVAGFLMMAHMIPATQLAAQAKQMESYGAHAVYVTDSAGALTVDGARDRVRAIRDAVQCEVGFHGHNNLSLAVANTLAAIGEGATWIDGAVRGFGAGAGNTATEVLAAVLDRIGRNPGLDVYRLMDIAEELVPPVMGKEATIDRAALTLGYCGVYSSFLRHAEKAAEKFGVDAREILTEVGRRKAVGGQEDMIIEVAFELSQRRQATT
ncbi:MAG: 4-hydroxy 2-oxovalerate aldolase [Candidatus Binataceae bacterium]|jgi:4-hydroxy-2-oxovalerate aldolase|nr:4-hydroxy 2-oxovalerate aldolase [Candidatus Binataceae bacterium]